MRTGRPSISERIARRLQNVKLMGLLTQEEVVEVRQKANKLKAAYSPPGN
jgi:hypothetical protein